MNYIGALAIEGKTFDYRDERAAAPRSRAEALRGPEGHHQAHEPRLHRRRQGHPGEDRRRQEPPDPRLRLRRDLRHRRPELRRVDLRARRRARARTERVAVEGQPVPRSTRTGHALPEIVRGQDQAEPPQARHVRRDDRPTGQKRISASRCRRSSSRGSASATTEGRRRAGRGRGRRRRCTAGARAGQAGERGRGTRPRGRRQHRGAGADPRRGARAAAHRAARQEADHARRPVASPVSAGWAAEPPALQTDVPRRR